MRARCCAPQQFREGDGAGGGCRTVLSVWGRRSKAGTSLPQLLGESQPLAFTHCQLRWEMQAGLQGQAAIVRLSKDADGSVSCQEPF